jgi:moderate conductance mechanosensitive channel
VPDGVSDYLWVPILVVGGAVALLGARWLIGRFERRLSVGATHDSETMKRSRTLATVLRASVTVVILVVLALMALEQGGVSVGPLLAAAGIGGVALGFGAQQIVRDIIGGFCILLENQFDVGDQVVVAGVEGTVESISLRTTVVRSVDGARHVISNGLIQASSNLTRAYSRYVFVLPLPYDADVDRAIEVARETTQTMRADPAWAADITGPLVVLGLDEFSENSVDVKLYIETLPGRHSDAGRELRKRLKAALGEAGIPLPFPVNR